MMLGMGKYTKEYMRMLGHRGGKKTGETKRRGDAQHYRDMAAKSLAVRLAKKAGAESNDSTTTNA